MAREPSPARRLERLRGVLEGAKSMLIIIQNNPDPDAIAAAAGLREIANELHDVACSVAHGGTVGRAENQALVRYLGLNTRALEDLEVDRFDRLAMVDAQPGAGNVHFDPNVKLDLVIDHHPIRKETRSARLTDVRSRLGATCTIIHEYLKAAEIEIPTPVATAMVYGIRSDTQDLGRESTRSDIDAFLDLYPLANPRALGRIVSAPLPRSYFSKLRRALDSATVHGTSVVSYLGVLRSPEMVAEAADLLLRVEGMQWAMTGGVIDDCLHLSLRSTDRERHAGKIARNLGGRDGLGGGHQTLAAVQVPLVDDGGEPAPAKPRFANLSRRFLRATGAPVGKGEPLCDE